MEATFVCLSSPHGLTSELWCGVWFCTIIWSERETERERERKRGIQRDFPLNCGLLAISENNHVVFTITP